MIKRHYADTRFGQIHLRELMQGTGDKSPLVLLHPMPYSSLYFTTVMPLFDGSRTIIGVDYPGCGQSDELPSTPTIEDYATAVLDALGSLGVERPCNFLGFHTGCLVAAEIALSQPVRVASVVLVDVPFFDKEQRESFKASMTTHKALTEDLSCLQKHWDSDVKSRVGMMPLARAVAIFADHLSAQGDGAEGFTAAFDYPVEEKLSVIDCPALVLATKSGLHAATLAAAKIVPDAQLQELLGVTRAAFEEGAQAIAEAVNAWLIRDT